MKQMRRYNRRSHCSSHFVMNCAKAQTARNKSNLAYRAAYKIFMSTLAAYGLSRFCCIAELASSIRSDPSIDSRSARSAELDIRESTAGSVKSGSEASWRNGVVASARQFIIPFNARAQEVLHVVLDNTHSGACVRELPLRHIVSTS